MELSEVIKERRSIRHYIKKEIPKNLQIDILEHAILSPSAHNRQPWYYIVINNDSEKEEISNLLREKSTEETMLTCEVIKECSTLILVFGEIENEVMDLISIGANIENMILRAKDLEIDSLWIGYIRKIEKELQTKYNQERALISAIALGYSEHKPKPRPRKPLEEVSKWKD